MDTNGHVIRNRRTTEITEDNNNFKNIEDDEQYDSRVNLRLRLETIRKILKGVEKQLDPDELIGSNGKISPSSIPKHNGQSKKEYVPSEVDDNTKEHTYRRVFKSRDSELTNILQSKHISPIYNIFVAVLIMLFCSTAIHDFLNTGTVNLGFGLITYSFSRFPISFLIWIGMNFAIFFGYFSYTFWVKRRSTLEGSKQHLFDQVLAISTAVFLIALLVVPTVIVIRLRLPFAITIALQAEEIRLLMKMWSFIRTNIPRSLKHNPTPSALYFAPTFQQFLYFLFAPTLIYQDEYPRTNRIRWGQAALWFLELLSLILYSAFIAERYLIPNCRDFGKPGVPASRLLAIVIDNALPSMLIMVIGFYGTLHCWFNCMAELLRFSDRMFYRDWWITKEYSDFYKTWNIVVYDWLFAFIYLDISGFISKNRKIRAFSVIIFSAMFHDYIMSVGVGFFIPIFLIVYGLGGPFAMSVSFKNKTFGNIWIWWTLMLGSGILVSTYIVEHYVRVNCPIPVKSPIWDFIIPRMITCPYS